MNKKFLNIVLVIVFILIWGSIIKKCTKSNHSDSIDNTSFRPSNTYDYDRSKSKDTFSLSLNDRDPFKASSRLRPKATSKTSKKTTNSSRKSTSKNSAWPTITYHGFVKSNRNATKLVIMKINKKLYREREKKVIEGVRIIKAYNDSIVVSFNNTLKSIKKAQ